MLSNPYYYLMPLFLACFLYFPFLSFSFPIVAVSLLSIFVFSSYITFLFSSFQKLISTLLTFSPVITFSIIHRFVFSSPSPWFFPPTFSSPFASLRVFKSSRLLYLPPRLFFNFSFLSNFGLSSLYLRLFFPSLSSFFHLFYAFKSSLCPSSPSTTTVSVLYNFLVLPLHSLPWSHIFLSLFTFVIPVFLRHTFVFSHRLSFPSRKNGNQLIVSLQEGEKERDWRSGKGRCVCGGLRMMERAMKRKRPVGN